MNTVLFMLPCSRHFPVPYIPVCATSLGEQNLGRTLVNLGGEGGGPTHSPQISLDASSRNSVIEFAQHRENRDCE